MVRLLACGTSLNGRLTPFTGHVPWAYGLVRTLWPAKS